MSDESVILATQEEEDQDQENMVMPAPFIRAEMEKFTKRIIDMLEETNEHVTGGNQKIETYCLLHERSQVLITTLIRKVEELSLKVATLEAEAEARAKTN